jgi:hypothetical protein
MARTTPNRGWAYPNFEENPYDTTIVGFFEDQDADVHAIATGIRVVSLGGTGQSALTAGSYLKGNGTSPVALQATPIPVADGGTGAVTLATGAYLRGAGTGAVTTHLGFYHAATVASSTVLTSTALFDRSLAIAAGLLNVAGTTITIVAGGTHSTSATPGTMLYAIRFFGNDIATFAGTPSANVTNGEWWIRVDGVIRSTGLSGQLLATGGLCFISGYGFVNSGVGSYLATQDLTTSNTVASLCVFNSGNSTSLRMLNMHVHYPHQIVS